MTKGGTFARRLIRGGLAAGLVALVAFGLGACTTTPPGPGPSDSAAATSRLVVGATLEPPTLDFSQSDAAAIPQLLLYNVYETLVKQDDTGAIRPLLATSYQLSDDRLAYTFTLDPKATFASGAPVDAAAVVASIERFKSAPNSTVAGPLGLVQQAVALDPGTVAVTLTRPSNSWLYDMTSTAGIVADPAVTDLANGTAGSGPYQFSDWVKGDRINLTANASYWGQRAAFAGVEFRYFADPNAMDSALLSGDIDVISDLTSPSSLAAFADTAKYQVVKGTSTGEVVLGFNHSQAPLKDLRVRQAINYAIDRQAIIDTAWGGQGQLIGSMVDPTDPYYEDLSQTYPYDPEKARQLLADAGLTDLALRLRVPVVPYATATAQIVASQLGQVGITATVDELDFSTWLSQVFTNGDYDLTIVNHAEPRDIASFAKPDYYWHYDNQQFQDLLAQADAAAPDQYVPLMKQAARLLAEDAAADWLFLFPHLVVAKAGLTGIPPNSATVSFDVTTIAASG